MSNFNDDMSPDEPVEDLFGDLEVSWLRESDLVDELADEPRPQEPPAIEAAPEPVAALDRGPAPEPIPMPAPEPERDPIPIEPAAVTSDAPPETQPVIPTGQDRHSESQAEQSEPQWEAPAASVTQLEQEPAAPLTPEPEPAAPWTPEPEPAAPWTPEPEPAAPWAAEPEPQPQWEAPAAYVEPPQAEAWPDVAPRREPDPSQWQQEFPELDVDAAPTNVEPAVAFEPAYAPQPLRQRPPKVKRNGPKPRPSPTASKPKSSAAVRSRPVPRQLGERRERAAISLVAMNVALGAALSLCAIALIAVITVIVQKALG